MPLASTSSSSAPTEITSAVFHSESNPWSGRKLYSGQAPQDQPDNVLVRKQLSSKVPTSTSARGRQERPSQGSGRCSTVPGRRWNSRKRSARDDGARECAVDASRAPY